MHAGTLSSTRARALRPFLSLLLACASITSLSGCRQKPPIPKEGDIVVWMHSPELIIKAKLGQRREHVVSDPRLDHLFYEPEYERFIGQFPIDYKPIPFPKFTEAERRDFLPNTTQNSCSKIYSSSRIQFDARWRNSQGDGCQPLWRRRHGRSKSGESYSGLLWPLRNNNTVVPC